MPGLRIGLTGGIGSGKSTVAALLVGHGATLVDTDAISRQITAPGGAAIESLRERFGPQAIGADGALDRTRMRKLAFADPGLRAALEAVLHPIIAAEALAAAASSRAPVVFDVPLLVEAAHWRQRVDRVLVVDCSIDTQVARVAQRPGWDADLARRVVEQQASRSRRRAAADACIYNDGIELAALRQEVEALARRWVLTAA